MNIHPAVFPLYFGELFSRKLEDFNGQNYNYPSHFHAQCSCEGCEYWDNSDNSDNDNDSDNSDKYGDNYNEYGLTKIIYEKKKKVENEQSKSFYECIKSRLPFNGNTIILKNIDEINLVAKTQPWQPCQCTYCDQLKNKLEINYKTKNGKVIMDDIQNLRNKILEIRKPSILPLCNPTNQQKKLYDLGGGNSMQVDVEVANRILLINILTSSEDGFVIDFDKDHDGY